MTLGKENNTLELKQRGLKIFRLAAEKCGRALGKSLLDLLPIVATVAFFQIFIFQQSLDNFGTLLVGMIMVVLGLAMFVAGLEMGLFPLGEQMARDFAKKGSVPWLVAFAFSLGFGTTYAEPALIAVSRKAAELASVEMEHGVENGAAINSSEEILAFRNRYAIKLRTVVAVSVGTALVLGVFRIIYGWPLHFLIIAGYALVILLTPFAPAPIIGVAYDAGGVTTSTITVPLATALGVGLASSIRGRNPLFDGFGLIAFASLTPIIFVLTMGIIGL